MSHKKKMPLVVLTAAAEPAAAEWPGRARWLRADLAARAAHMWAMMLSPNSEHFTSVAPSIWRAKS